MRVRMLAEKPFAGSFNDLEPHGGVLIEGLKLFAALLQGRKRYYLILGKEAGDVGLRSAAVSAARCHSNHGRLK